MSQKRIPGPKKGTTPSWPRRPWPRGFSERLRETIARSLYAGNITALERASGVRRATIYSYMKGDEAGKKHLDALTLFALAKTLNVRAEWLLFGNGADDALSKGQNRIDRTDHRGTAQ